jgi:Mce-associated membrane protein
MTDKEVAVEGAAGGEAASVAPQPSVPESEVEAERSRRLGLPVIVTAVVVVALVVALVLTQLQLSHQRGLDGDRTTALAAARTDATDVATYSYQHLAADFAKVEGEATPAFRRSFEKSSGALTKVLKQYKATASAKILESGLVSVSSTKAVALLFVNQTVANTAQKNGPTTDDSRIEVTLDRSGGRWLIDRLKLL